MPTVIPEPVQAVVMSEQDEIKQNRIEQSQDYETTLYVKSILKKEEKKDFKDQATVIKNPNEVPIPSAEIYDLSDSEMTEKPEEVKKIEGKQNTEENKVTEVGAFEPSVHPNQIVKKYVYKGVST